MTTLNFDAIDQLFSSCASLSEGQDRDRSELTIAIANGFLESAEVAAHLAEAYGIQIEASTTEVKRTSVLDAARVAAFFEGYAEQCKDEPLTIDSLLTHLLWVGMGSVFNSKTTDIVIGQYSPLSLGEIVDSRSRDITDSHENLMLFSVPTSDTASSSDIWRDLACSNLQYTLMTWIRNGGGDHSTMMPCYGFSDYWYSCAKNSKCFAIKKADPDSHVLFLLGQEPRIEYCIVPDHANYIRAAIYRNGLAK